MKRFISLLTAIFMILSFAGCGKKNTSTGSAWQYSYAGIEHDYLRAISEYLVTYDAENLEIADGMIPCITSVEIDNEECTPGKGSAIFLHCYREQRTYTGGCISILLESMEYVLTHISPDSKIIIRESSL